MSKAVRISGSVPKESKFKFVNRVNYSTWDEQELVDWVKQYCVGTVWYEIIKFEDSYGAFKHYEVKCWFSKKQDAMMFRLNFNG